MGQCLATFDSHCAALEGVIKGKPGARRIRTYMSTARRELASLQKGKKTLFNKETEMDYRKVLGLPETATDAEVEAKIATLSASQTTLSEAVTAELTSLRTAVATMQETAVNERVLSEVDAAVKDGRVIPAQREAMVSYAKSDIEGFRNLVKATPRMAFLSAPIGSEGTTDADQDESHPSPQAELVHKQTGATATMREAAKAKTTRELMEEHSARVNGLGVVHA